MGRAPDSNASMYAPRRRAPLGRRLRVPDGAQVMHAAKDANTPWPAITASAQVLSKRKMDRKVKRAPVEGWQNEAWAMRAETGELRFIGDRQANACSQARLYVGKKETPSSDVVPVDDGSIPAQLSAALFANAGMVEQTLRRAAQHLIFNGESNLLIREDENGQLTWDAHSITEITGSPGRWKLNNGVDKPRDIGDDEILIRAWRADPEYSARADAPVRAILSTARELRAMSMYVSAQMESRLAGSGLLLIPDGLESMHSQGGDDDDDFDLADELTDYLVETVKDRDLASSIVPFMLTGTPDLIEKVRHMTFSTELDQQVPDLRDESIRRIGLGMDSDPSVLLGQASSNHWSAWAVDENEIKFGVQPIVAIICHALTVGLLRPLLVDQGVSDPDLYSVWYDTTPLLVRPDRSKDAQALYDKGVISDAVLRRENGFDDTDAPSDEERTRAIIRELLSTRSDLIDKWLPALGIVVPGVTDNPVRVDDTLSDAVLEQQQDNSTPPAPDTTPAVAPEADNGPPIPGETEASQ
ncbi:hypothetical protein [Gordonia sp. SND2]|uniref:hypothetical protein n=1 Tax=Gordonia sp. SND2 TaxID=3388659 RepID=UPI00398A6A7C